MISINNSSSKTPNESFVESKREARENNAEWCLRNRPKDCETFVILAGSRSPLGLRLRIAQSHARNDMMPSGFSHALLCGGIDAQDPSATPIWEVPLEGFREDFPVKSNGVAERTLREYRQSSSWPNLAILGVPVSFEEVQAGIDGFRRQRNVVDALEGILAWYAFAWGVGGTGNPLLADRGIPGAMFVEYVVGAAGFDLTPGLASRSSCPEAIWQAARWWQDFHEQGTQAGRPLTGAWRFDHEIK